MNDNNLLTGLFFVVAIVLVTLFFALGFQFKFLADAILFVWMGQQQVAINNKEELLEAQRQTILTLRGRVGE